MFYLVFVKPETLHDFRLSQIKDSRLLHNVSISSETAEIMQCVSGFSQAAQRIYFYLGKKMQSAARACEMIQMWKVRRKVCALP